MGDDDLLTLEQAQRRLGLGRGTLLLLARRHQLPRFKDPGGGRRTMFRSRDLQKLQEPIRRLSAARASKARFID